ncbi:hypothetical protein [Nocardia sp. NBC_00403]|uniref:hypothetical protein n=1 Tax=Nocardia sp. NBC_00403 TaxID=2975990 RepID=UPI002E24B385
MTEHAIQLPTAGESTYDTYDRIRERGEVVPIELPGGVPAWIATSYQAVSEVLDDKLFSKSAAQCPALHDGTIPADWPMRALTDIDHMLNKDGLDHRRLRKTISQAFTPARVAALEPRIEKIAANLIARICRNSRHTETPGAACTQRAPGAAGASNSGGARASLTREHAERVAQDFGGPANSIRYQY